MGSYIVTVVVLVRTTTSLIVAVIVSSVSTRPCLSCSASSKSHEEEIRTQAYSNTISCMGFSNVYYWSYNAGAGAADLDGVVGTYREKGGAWRGVVSSCGWG